jgi:hypothetical protein
LQPKFYVHLSVLPYVLRCTRIFVQPLFHL